MTRARLRLAALALGGALLALVVGSTPAAAAGYDSVTEALLRNLHRKLLIVAVILAVLVEAALFYAAVKFHGNENPKPTRENRRLEITWTIAVAVILLFVGASSYAVLTDPMVSATPDTTQPQADDVHVRIVGQNWFWRFSYRGENVTTTNTLVLPTDRTIVLSVTSRDVIHAVHIPSIGVKQDAIPGQTNTFRTRLTKTGTHRLYCAEYCGTGHSKMLATVRVVPPDQYRQWLADHRGGQGRANATASNGSVPAGDAASVMAG